MHPFYQNFYFAVLDIYSEVRISLFLIDLRERKKTLPNNFK